ncbi:MAG: aldehyde dehydrogenase family protein [Kurthia sp.]|nr:aldehyde dehydrogenase family protein [Candidatus Kurthia equi]
MKLQHYVNGQWVEIDDMNLIPVLNPANGKEIAQVPMASKEVVHHAIEVAKKAQKSWALVPAPKRADYLYAIGQKLKERKEQLAQILTAEMGKVIEEARGEVQEGIDMAFYMAGEGRRMFGQTTPSELPNKFAMSVRSPIGVVGLITPWNFPIAIATWKSFPALVAGNAVIWKPSTETPMMAYELAKIFDEVGIPPGVANVVFGSGNDVGTTLIEHPDVKVISFTGSTETGSKVAELGGKHLKKVSLEMGGKNAIIVLEDADLDLAVEGILWSALGTAGQRCTACSRVIVHADVKEQVEQRLLAAMSELKLGDGADEEVSIGPVIHRAALHKIHSYTQQGLNQGARLLTGGKIADDGALADGSYYEPTLFTDVAWDSILAQEEIFGPVISLITVHSLQEAIEVNNSVKYGLSSSIFTQDINRVFEAQRDLDTGIVYVNAGTTGAEIHLPFGGTKGTGNGHRDSGVQALDVYTEWKSVYIDYSGKLQRAQIDTE